MDGNGGGDQLTALLEFLSPGNPRGWAKEQIRILRHISARGEGAGRCPRCGQFVSSKEQGHVCSIHRCPICGRFTSLGGAHRCSIYSGRCPKCGRFSGSFMPHVCEVRV